MVESGQDFVGFLRTAEFIRRHFHVLFPHEQRVPKSFRASPEVGKLIDATNTKTV
jgi:hypothetical protein